MIDDGAATIPPWMEMGRVLDDGFPITALQFDPVEELLWVRRRKKNLKRERETKDKISISI